MLKDMEFLTFITLGFAVRVPDSKHIKTLTPSSRITLNQIAEEEHRKRAMHYWVAKEIGVTG